MDLVSIIVPSYFQGSYIDEALKSVMLQTYKNWECIIVNDGSTDNTELIALEYCKLDSRFKYFFTDNKGVSAARNLGIKLSNGKYILPLDADDKISPYYLDIAIKVFLENDSISLVYGEAERFGIAKGKWVLDDYTYSRLLISNIIYCSAVFKRSDFESINGFSENLIHGYEDWDFWIRLLNKNSIVVKLPDTVFYYRVKEISRTTQLKLEDRKALTEKIIFSNNAQIYGENLYELISLVRLYYKGYKNLERIRRTGVYKTFHSIRKTILIIRNIF